MVNVRYSILGVEGPHDQAFIGKLLDLYGLEKFKGERKALDPFWVKFIPAYPKNGRLYDRLDMPSIFSSQTHSVAIYQGEGSNLCRNLKARIREHDPYIMDIDAFGLILDADTTTPQQKAVEYIRELHELYPNLIGEPGKIATGKPRTGIYVLPDNNKARTLDSILIDCATLIYPAHKVGAIQYLEGLNTVHTTHWKRFDREKAIVATIVSVLKPGAANASSISQDDWICNESVVGVFEVALLGEFLINLLELPEKLRSEPC
jgi:hypothetical protein